MTWADFKIFNLIDFLETFVPDITAPLPDLAAHYERVRDVQSVKDYLQNRPEDKMISALKARPDGQQEDNKIEEAKD